MNIIKKLRRDLSPQDCNTQKLEKEEPIMEVHLPFVKTTTEKTD